MSDTTGWKNARKTINGREYIIGSEAQYRSRVRLWWAYCDNDNWTSENYMRQSDAKRAARAHAEEKG